MTILVTGALGFFGCHLLVALRAHGLTDVVAVDRVAPDPVAAGALAGPGRPVRVECVDLLDRPAAASLVARVRPRLVIHAAAITPNEQEDGIDPARVFDVNLGSALSLMAALGAAATARRAIHISSSAVYGAAAGLGAINEDDVVAPRNLYGAAKAAAEVIMMSMAKTAGCEMASARLGSIVGRFERPTTSRSRMSPLHRLARALRSGATIRAAGPDIRRDYLSAAAAADAVVRLLLAKEWRFPTFNVGGDAITWREAVDRFARRGLSATWVETGATPGFDMTVNDARPTLNVARLRSHIGEWPLTSLDAAVDELIESAIARPPETAA